MKIFQTFVERLIRYGLEPLGLYYSKYRAYVVENHDPEALSRLKLLIPHIDSTKPLEKWVPPCNVFGGINYGMQVLPQKGDVVYVEFEKGKLRNPLWSHGYYGYKEKPLIKNNPNLYWFISPKGHEVMINDTDNIISVTIKEGLTFTIKKDQIFLGKDSSKSEPMVLGKTLTEKLETQDKKIMAIIDAIKNSKPAAGSGDGGTALQAGIVAALSLYKEEDFTNITSKNNTLD